jgi:hypothetical protein
MSDAASLEQLAIDEIVALHAFFVAWLRSGPPSAHEFRRCEGALAADFRIITPDGQAHGRDAILNRIRSARGTAGDAFDIRIVDPRAVWSDGNAILLEYVEEQYRDGRTTRRRSTGLLTRNSTAPNGIEWRHVQETWMDAAQDENR